jgi:hypothetical protein
MDLAKAKKEVMIRTSRKDNLPPEGEKNSQKIVRILSQEDNDCRSEFRWDDFKTDDGIGKLIQMILRLLFQTRRICIMCMEKSRISFQK